MLKNTNVLKLISCLGKFASLSEEILGNCQLFIQTILYTGTPNESYVETRVRLYQNQKTKNSISLPPDPDSCKQALRRVNYQAYHWFHCMEKIHLPISFEANGWFYNEDINMVTPQWFVGPQFPPSIVKKKGKDKKQAINDGYEADLENGEKNVPSAPKKRKKSQPLKIQQSELVETSTGIASDEKESSLNDSDSSLWERLSEFEEMISDSSDSDWLP